MTSPADLTLYNRDGQLIAVAEVKNKQGTSREWAAKLRRNILAHGRHYNAGSHHSRSLIVRNRQPRRRRLLLSFRAKRWKSGRITLLRGN